MVDSPDALGDDRCSVTGMRAIDEPGEGLVEVEITVGCSGAAGVGDHVIPRQRACGRNGRASTPSSGSSVIGCVWPGTRVCADRTENSLVLMGEVFTFGVHLGECGRGGGLTTG
jgi:hypothetical protein